MPAVSPESLQIFKIFGIDSPAVGKDTRNYQYWQVQATQEGALAGEIVNQNDRFVYRCRRGIPPQFRWRCWKTMIGSESVRSEYPEGYYKSLENANHPYSKAINTDLQRTFPELECFQVIGLPMMSRILNAISCHFPSIGYCQGMNFVCAFIILVSGINPDEEEEIFWFFGCLLEKYKLSEMFRDTFPLLRRYSQAFEIELQRQQPEVHSHLQKHSIETSVFLHRWLLTMFVTSVPLGSAAVIWDTMICKGPEVLVCCSLALLEIGSVTIRRLRSMEHIMVFFRNLKDSDSADVYNIGVLVIKKAFRAELSGDVLKLISVDRQQLAVDVETFSA